MRNVRFIFVSFFLLILIFVVIGLFRHTFIKLPIKSVEKPKMSGAMEALTFWTRSRAYPEKDIPSDKFYKEFVKEKRKLQKRSSSLNNDSVWESMGPHNVPGRIISLAVNPKNPQTLYAGSASGGLWRTFDASTGANWHRVHCGFPVLGVMGLAIDPVDTNTVYIGTGEVYGYQQSIGGEVIRTTRGSYGIGILKTTDGGTTWEKSLDWTYNQQRGVQCIRINPSRTSTVFAATSEGIYKSVDAGESWDLLLPVLMGQDIVIHPNDTNKVLVSCGNLGSFASGVYLSTNAGLNWNKITSFPSFTGKTLLEPYRASPDIVYASVADSLNGKGLYKTTDFGTNWNRVHSVDVQRYQGWFSHWVAVKSDDASEIVHGGVDIYKSHDGGKNLSEISGVHVDHHNYAHDPTNPNILYIACDGGVYRTTNFGDSYQSIGYGLQTAQFYNGFSSSHSDSNLALGGLQDNNTVIYSGTKDWRLVIGGDGCWTAINQMNDDILYGEYQRNNILKSVNRGRSFSPATSGLYGDAAFVAPYVISESNPMILYSGRNRIFKTTDGAENWNVTNNGQKLDNNFALSMAVSRTNPDIVYTGTAPLFNRGHIFRTINGGNTWSDVTGSLPDLYPMDITIDPHDNSTVYVVFGGFGSGHVFKATNSGQTWQDITGTLPDVPTLSICIDPLNSDHLYVGNDIGVYFSEDAGDSWELFAENLPEAFIAMDLNICQHNRTVRLATHGNGAYQRALVFQPSVYLVFKLDPIPNVVMVSVDVNFTAEVTNIGSQQQTEVSTVELRVVDESDNELFKETETVSGLSSQESRDVTFTNQFTPQQVGSYEIQLIEFGTASQPRNDTTRQTIRAILPPSIANAMVTKQACRYEEISGGTVFMFQDDSYTTITLPFNFTFDQFEYDKLQICANGWCEFGTGVAGTERGVSTTNQLGQVGANENGRMASTSRPTKALGPWWEDLNPEGGGTVSYKVLGQEPNRVLIIQWKNMRAYWDPQTTTRVNFQVRLYETSNLIEYRYGDVARGTFIGSDLGAAIGFKDHFGGDYHFYDIAVGGIAPVSEHNTYLSPLTDWPGPDSCFVIQTLTTDVDERTPELPTKLRLHQNYPNPFNPQTHIHYDLPVGSFVSLKIYNSKGQEVRTLVNQAQTAGRKVVVWNGLDQNGSVVGSGLYFYRLKVGKEYIVRKMTFIK